MSHKIAIIFLVFQSFSGFALQQNLFGPQAAGDAAGNLAVVWTRAGAASIYEMQQATLPAGGSWSAPVTISSSPANAFYPTIAMNHLGDIFYLWQLSQSSALIIQAASATFGGAVSPALSLSSEMSSMPKTVIDHDGNGFAVWQQSNLSSNRLVLAFNPVSLGYWILTYRTLATPLAPMADVAIEPVTGDIVVVWQESNGSSSAIYAVAIPKGGVIPTTASQLSASQSNATMPQVVYSATGEALAIWQQLSNGQISIFTSSLTGNTWSSPSSFSAPLANLIHGSIAINALGEALLVAEEQPITGGPSAIIAARRSSSGVWGVLTPLSTDSTENATYPKVAMSQDGSLAVGVAVWSVSQAGTYGIRATTLLPSMPWSDPVFISAPTEKSLCPTLWMSNTGANAAAFWQLRTTNNPAIEASLFSTLSGTWSAPEMISGP